MKPENMKCVSVALARAACAGLILGVLAWSPPAARAASPGSEVGVTRKVGIGFIVGEPTGLSGKYWLTRTEAMDFGAAWSFVDESSFHIHADYLVHDFSLFTVDHGRMPLYYGIGGRLKFADQSRLGVRGVIGLDFITDGAPVDVFAEIAPVLDLVPRTDFTLMGGVGVRIYFAPSWQ